MLQRSKSSRALPQPLSGDTWSGYRPPGQSAIDRYVRGVAGLCLARPWFDPVVSWALKRYFFPLSRLWAAAAVSAGSPERFFSEVPLAAYHGPRDRVLEALAKFEQARVEAVAVDQVWDAAFFGDTAVSTDQAVAIEAARLQAHHNLGATRLLFRFLLKNDVARVKYRTPSVEEVERIYGRARSRVDSFVAAPAAMPRVEVSRRIPASVGTDHWLRFSSPSRRLDDIVTARVLEPAEPENAPTVIYGHGVCVEFDHWQGLIDEAQALRARGMRVIRPEAPWHGRRVKLGSYGGEDLIATFPLGPLDLFTGAAREWAVLADWARTTSGGPLVFAGSSLGALTAQFCADVSVQWPDRLAPDALLLITHCSSPADTMAADGQLSQIWGDKGLLDGGAGGWTAKSAEQFLAILRPRHRLSMPARNVVSVLGRYDKITPFQDGQACVERWCVPEGNVFTWNRGHFTVPMTMRRNNAPVERLAEIVGL